MPLRNMKNPEKAEEFGEVLLVSKDGRNAIAHDKKRKTYWIINHDDGEWRPVDNWNTKEGIVSFWRFHTGEEITL